jgi:hypothetical protein
MAISRTFEYLDGRALQIEADPLLVTLVDYSLNVTTRHWQAESSIVLPRAAWTAAVLIADGCDP